MRRTERTERAAVSGDEHERVGRLRLHGRRALDRRVGTGELDQRSGAGRVVVHTAAVAGVVAVRGDHDCLVGRPVDDGDEVLELDLAAARDLRSEALHSWRLEAEELEPLRDPAGGTQPAGRARRSVRILARELARASCAAIVTSKVAGSVGGGSGCGRATLKAASRSGRATSSHVPRTSRAFTGRSTEPRRGRPRVGSARLGGAIAPASVGNAAARI